ncbi:MAG: hypothetical protein WC619_01505 [Patescibacteria group bacterium]
MPELLLLLFVISVFVLAIKRTIFFFCVDNLATGLGLLLAFIAAYKWKFYTSLSGQCPRLWLWLARGRLFLLGMKKLRVVRPRPP